MSKKFYITTPIYYINDIPHIGHSYCTIAADTIARFKRWQGYDVLFVTGVDEHGQKAESAAKQKNLPPQEYVDQMSIIWKNSWKKLNISFDDFIRTTEERHIKVVKYIFEKLYKNGDIYKGEYKGWYCTPCETFWLKSQLIEDKCPNPECKRKLTYLSEDAYFFKLSKYQESVKKFIEENSSFIIPESRRNEAIKFIEQGLHDTCVSRTSFSWGIPLPFEENHIIYVWVDALINYLSVAGYLSDEEKFNKFYPADIHLIGKDILRFHAILWPAILLASELPIPKTIATHGFWNVEGEKMSKSKGNVISPEEIIKKIKEKTGISEELSIEVLRYFLLKEVSFGADGNFSESYLYLRYNSDLANDLGNLLHRTLSMIEKYENGIIPKSSSDDKLKNMILDTIVNFENFMEKLEFSLALGEIWKLINFANKYIDEVAPWKLKKEGKEELLKDVMYNLAEIISKSALLISPFMPKTSEIILRQLGIKKTSYDELKGWNILTGNKINREKPLFPRVE